MINGAPMLKTKLTTFLTSSLQRKLMLALMAIATFVIGVSGIYLLRSQQQIVSDGLKARAIYMTNMLSKNLSLPMWDMNLKSIQDQLDMVMSDPEIYSVALYEGEQKQPLVLKKRDGQAVDGIERDSPVIYVRDHPQPPVELGRVRIVYTRSYMYQALRQTRMLILTGIFFLLASLSAATYILLRRMVQKPVGELLAMAHRIAEGDLEARIPVTSRDEIGLLGEKFNDMTDKLKQTIGGLSKSEQNYRSINETLEEELSQRRRAETELQRYQENLEDLVKSRTSELSKAIDQMNAEIAERNKTEEVLKQANEKLGSSTADLQQKLGEMDNARKAMLNILEDLDVAKKETEATMQQINVMSQEQVAIFESLTLGIAFVKDRIILRGNSKLGELFGRPLDEMVGQTTQIWYKNEEEYLGIAASTYEDLKRQTIHQREQELPRKDGSLFWCFFRIRAMDTQDISQGIVCTLEDITERKQAEKELKERMEDLERFSRLTINREEKMIQLKEEINALREQMGKEIKYKIVE
jgi:PAS domain S-box-containing protein